MAKIRPRAKAPKKASAGDVVTIKTLISHPMESGQRKDRKTGELIPRKIINRFEATLDGESIVAVDLDPAISSNPYFEFSAKIEKSGQFHFKWVDDDGSVYEKKSKIKVA